MKGITTHRCARRIVIALLVKDEKAWIGTNWCERPQRRCPRGNLPHGEGYEICRDTCGQPHHAEVDAMVKAGPSNCKGATMVLFNHRFCNDCLGAMYEAGISRRILLNGPEPMKTEEME